MRTPGACSWVGGAPSKSFEGYRSDLDSIHQVVSKVLPDCCHLAAQSIVSETFDDEFSILNAIR